MPSHGKNLRKRRSASKKKALNSTASKSSELFESCNSVAEVVKDSQDNVAAASLNNINQDQETGTQEFVSADNIIDNKDVKLQDKEDKDGQDIKDSVNNEQPNQRDEVKLQEKVETQKQEIVDIVSAPVDSVKNEPKSVENQQETKSDTFKEATQKITIEADKLPKSDIGNTEIHDAIAKSPSIASDKDASKKIKGVKISTLAATFQNSEPSPVKKLETKEKEAPILSNIHKVSEILSKMDTSETPPSPSTVASSKIKDASILSQVKKVNDIIEKLTSSDDEGPKKPIKANVKKLNNEIIEKFKPGEEEKQSKAKEPAVISNVKKVNDIVDKLEQKAIEEKEKVENSEVKKAKSISRNENKKSDVGTADPVKLEEPKEKAVVEEAATKVQVVADSKIEQVENVEQVTQVVQVEQTKQIEKVEPATTETPVAEIKSEEIVKDEHGKGKIGTAQNTTTASEPQNKEPEKIAEIADVSKSTIDPKVDEDKAKPDKKEEISTKDDKHDQKTPEESQQNKQKQEAQAPLTESEQATRSDKPSNLNEKAAEVKEEQPIKEKEEQHKSEPKNDVDQSKQAATNQNPNNEEAEPKTSSKCCNLL